jgi:pimeloyl-ACP methyl ester carboxylesterase
MEEEMPTELSLKKTEIRNKLRKFKIRLERDVFFVPGWSDQGCICWTEPYMESGVDRRAGWEYTVKDWEYIVENPEKMHYLRLVENEDSITIKRNKEGKIKKVEFQSDQSYNYTNFFQFAELVKRKIRAIGAKQIDLVGHSMGGLDIISAVALDRKLDDYKQVKDFITTDPLNGVGLLITVATPYKGSIPADLVKNTKIDEWFGPKWSEGIGKQCENLAHTSEFISIINRKEIRERLFKKAKIGVYTFLAGNDRAVRPSDAFIEGANNRKPFQLVSHSQKMGITQDPRMHYELFKLLKG